MRLSMPLVCANENHGDQTATDARRRVVEKTRRRLLQGIAATGFAVGTGTMNAARAQGTQPDLVLRNGQFTTLDRSNPQANAVAIKDGRFVAVGQEREVMALAGSGSKVIDLKGRRAIPGLIDSHTHIIRGGLNYNMELRWDGVRSLADAMTMLKRQIAVTPPPQWVRVVGGFTERQFAEKRLPTIEELNAAAPDTPVFILHLYDRALLNGAALRVVGYTKDTPNPPGGEIVKDAVGNPTGLLLAQPAATILYATLAKGPKLPQEYQVNSTRHFMRELNRLGVTGAVDAGGGFQNYPEDYRIIDQLHRDGQLTVRIAYNLFTQKPEGEFEDFSNWIKIVKPGQGTIPIAPMAPAKCSCTQRPITKTSRSRVRKCPPTWSRNWKKSFVCSRRTAGLGACTQHITRRSDARWTFTRRSTAIFRSKASTGSSTTAKRLTGATSIVSRHSAAASRSSIAWPTRAITLSSVME